jgi:hypothetical protein
LKFCAASEAGLEWRPIRHFSEQFASPSSAAVVPYLSEHHGCAAAARQRAPKPYMLRRAKPWGVNWPVGGEEEEGEGCLAFGCR